MNTYEMTLISIYLLLVLVSWLPISKSKKWWIRIPEYFSLQLGVLLFLGSLVGLFYFGEWGLGIMFLAGLATGIIKLSRVLPYTDFWSKSVSDGDDLQKQPSITTVVSNVLMTNDDYDNLIKLIHLHKPDIFVGIENDSDWTNSIVDACGHIYPYSILRPRDDTYGMMILSKHPLVEKEVLRIYNNTPTVQCIINHTDMGPIHFFVLHPKPPVPGESNSSHAKDKELLTVANIIKELPADAKVIVTGDMNDVAWSRTTKKFLKISNLCDVRIGRGMMFTFPTYFIPMGFPLDQLFCSEHFAVVSLEKLKDVNSDHYPISCELVLK